MPRSRDSFLDGLRTLAIVRVVLLHLCLRAEFPAAAALSFAFPGMALLFFVSGAAAAWSLEPGTRERRERFWLSRGRRLLVPYWAYGLAVVGLAFALELRNADPHYHLRPASLSNWVLPLAVPHLSPALDRLAGHLWFLAALLFLLASAPLGLAWHRRRPYAGALALAALGVLLEVLVGLDPGLPVPGLLRHALLFGAAFQLGFGWADGSLARVERGTWLWAVLLCALFAISVHQRSAPGSALQAVPLAHVALGLALIAACLGLRGVLERLFATRVFTRLRTFVRPRAYTLFLWGPAANELAWRLCQRAGWSSFALYALFALALLASFGLALGPLEAWAARRGRVLRGPRPASSTERREAA